MNEVSKNEKPAMENPVNNAAEAAAAAAPESLAAHETPAAPESGKAHKKIHPGKAALAVVACLMLLLSTVTSGMYLYDRFYGYGGEDGYQDFGPTKEDGVLIADEYTIESTLPISDAYKSGDTDKLDDRQKQVLEAASKVIDEVIKDGMSDYEKECAIYEWIVKNVPFDEGMTTLIDKTPGQQEAGDKSADTMDTETTVTSDGGSGDADAGTPYGALIEHRAVCAGYATTFRLFMQMLDIECMVVHSTDCVHSWDLVKIDDHWYHVDIYSDVDSAMYGNFNLNDAMMMQDWDREYFPAADSLAANPAYKDRVTCKSVYEIPGIVRKAMEDHSGRVFVEFEETPSAEDQQLATYMVNAISMDLDYNNSLKASVFGGTWLPTGEENEMRLFSVEIMYMDDTENSSSEKANQLFDEQTRKKADEALQEAFGDQNENISIQDGIY